MSDDQPITVTIEKNVRRITFDRPDKANALSLGLARSFLAEVRAAVADETCEVVVISGNGRFLSAGGDLTETMAAAEAGPFIDELAATMHTALLELRASRLVSIVAVSGIAAGAGAGIAFSADITICAESAVFVPAYLAAGLSPDCGVSYFLTRSAGRQRAVQYLLEGAKLSAGRALDWGLVSHVVPDAEFAGALEDLVTSVSTKSLQSWATVKALLRDDDLAAHLDEERQGIAAMVGHPVTAAALLAFTSR
ncbi:MAG: 2-(1,2-epoxy,2-dihydrophenyl)acetyl-CoA isomerase [Subtercola sp.]|nr:2-(1,2-epoxy,2-dihydrophenyl)acetyl-CoA isomerase [Subtercola sp.]